MMGSKAIEPKLYLSYSLDANIPPDHLVRRLAAAIDFDFVRGLVRKHYSHTGQPSVDPVVLFKLWLLGYLFNIRSERRLCEEAGLNLAWRWFLGYELDEPIPDHSVLSKARRRFGVRVYEKFFAHIVRLCEAAGLVEGDVLFIDSTLTKANAAQQSLRSKALLGQRLPRTNNFVNELWVVNREPDEPTGATGGKSRPELGGVRKDSRRSAVNDFAVSRTDPDAQRVIRPGAGASLSHKTHFSVDGGKANIITAVEVRPAGESDGKAVGRVLDKHHAALGRPIRELVGDGGYGSQTAINACVERDVKPLLRIRTPSNPHGGLHRSAFTYVPERDLYICPEGKELRRIGQARKRQQTVYKVAAGTCRDCPLKAKCCPGPSDRVVTRRWDMLVVEEMQLRAQTRRGRRLLNRRQHVSEHINADAKEKHGMHRAQFRGRGKMQIQALLTAATMNLKRLMTRRPVAQSGMGTWRTSIGKLVAFRAFRWPRSRCLSANRWSGPVTQRHSHESAAAGLTEGLQQQAQ
jgi:transposase